MRFAAIDIGSNAVRLLLARVIEDGKPLFKRESFVRIPMRLGEDAFCYNRISEEKTARLVHIMKGFGHLIAAYPALDYIACATSAMRDAENGRDIVDTVHRETGIRLDIIDGKREAEMIYANHIEEQLSPKKYYLYCDVGGGSTELTVIARGKVTATGSFNVGTVRMLQRLVDDSIWDEMREWTVANTKKMTPIYGIGSGGNINKIFRLSRIKDGKTIGYERMRKIYKHLKSYSYEDRVNELGLRADRADVIIPASKIYLSVMKWAGAKKMYVPQVGLSDGIVHVLHERHRKRTTVP